MPSKVRKLRSLWRRIAVNASANSSPRTMALRPLALARRPRLFLLLGVLDLDRSAGLDLAQRAERPGDQRLSALEPRFHLDRELADHAGRDRLEARLARLHQIDPLLVARRVGVDLLPGLPLDLA